MRSGRLEVSSFWKTARVSLVSAICVLLITSVANAASLTQDFTFENDGDFNSPPYGTLVIDEVETDQLKFTITIDSQLGPDRDVQSFGFMLDFDGATLVAGGDALSLATDAMVQGRNSTFDYVASFGNGAPILNPVIFTIEGVGLDLSAIYDSGVSFQNNKPDAQFMAHVQSTGTTPGSEAIGGNYVPIPGAVWLFGTGLVALAGFARRKRAVTA